MFKAPPRCHFIRDNVCHNYDRRYTPGVMRVFVTRAGTLKGATLYNTQNGKTRTILNTLLKG